MKLTGTNSSILQTIRQPTNLEEQNSLVFVYPLIFDKFLERKWGNVLRDFFTTQFMSQIKISNVLNITSNATRHTVDNSTLAKFENPAEMTAQSDALGLLTNRPANTQAPYQQYYNQVAKHEYQDKINQFRGFIRSQVMVDPRFNDTRPIISNITIENLIDIPLIIGTKLNSVQSLPLFWILFFATGQYREDNSKTEGHADLTTGEIKQLTHTIRLDKQQSFEYIGRFIKDVVGANFLNYEQYLDKIMEIPSKSAPSNRISSLIHGLDTDIDKALKVFMRCTNERMYSDEVGFSQNKGISIENAYLDSMDSQSGVRMKAQTLFTSMLANYVMPVTQSVTDTIVGVNEVRIASKMSALSTDLLSYFMDRYGILESTFKRILTDQLDENSSETALSQLNAMEKMCQANAQLSVIPILSQFKNLSFNLTSDRKTIIQFVTDLNKISAQLDIYTKGLKANLYSMSLDSHEVGEEIKNTNVLYKIFYKYFTDNDFVLNADGNSTGVEAPDTGIIDMMNPLNNRISQFLGNASIDKYFPSICKNLDSICTFMAYYVFFSYLCENMSEIKAKVEIQKKDALDFPNYCLVLRKEVIESLYGALASANYKSAKDGESFDEEEKQASRNTFSNKVRGGITNLKTKVLHTPPPTQKTKPVNSFTNFKLNETDIMQMIRVLNNRLNIPNLIVVDDKQDTIYYKWMYSGGSIGKLTMSTLQNYIQQQQEILPGY